MKKAKIKEQKEIKKSGQPDINIRTGIIVFLSVIVFFLGFYLLTDYLLENRKDPNNNNSNNNSKVENEIAFIKLLSQKEDDYYALAIFGNDKSESIYKRYTKDLTNIYYIDMEDPFNKNHITDKTNISEKVKDITLVDSTLFHIKDGKVEKYYVGNVDIINHLKTLLKVKS